ncbi:MAG TPA: hypothetical protein VKK79_17650 [Candidatus Lokiarchaeia archaeon]|nr:hypothetical protein [Candidatus Lokiarchaeia archaeon]
MRRPKKVGTQSIAILAIVIVSTCSKFDYAWLGQGHDVLDPK